MGAHPPSAGAMGIEKFGAVAMKSMIRTVVCVLMLALSPLVRGQVLDQIPQGSLVVVKVSGLGATSDKLTAFFQARGFAALMGDMARPLDAGLKQLGIKQGVDRTGDLAMAIVDDGKGSLEGGDPPLLALIPVTDYKAFVANFPNATQENGLDVLPIAGNPAPVYSASWGKYAAVSAMKSLLGQKPMGVRLDGATAKLVGASDISVWVDGQAAAKKMQPALDDIRAMLPQIVSMMPTANAKMGPVFTAYLTQIFNGFSRVAQDEKATTIALSVGADDIKASILTEFLPDSYMARLANSIKGTDKSFLDGLPAGDYVACGGVSLDSTSMGPWLSDALGPIEKAAQDCGEDGQKLAADIDGLQKLMMAEKSVSFDMTAANPPAIISIIGGDAATIRAGIGKSMEASNDISRLMAANGTGQSHITIKSDAKNVAGISFDAVTTTMENMDPNAAQMIKSLPGPLGQFMQAVTSPNGTTAYVGQIDASRLVSAANLPDDALATLVQNLQSGNSPLADDKAIAGTAGLLPKTRLMAFYVRRPGSAMDEAPLGITASTETNSFRTDVVIPGGMATAIVQGAMSIMQQIPGAATPPPGPGQPNQPAPPMPDGGL